MWEKNQLIQNSASCKGEGLELLMLMYSWKKLGDKRIGDSGTFIPFVCMVSINFHKRGHILNQITLGIRNSSQPRGLDNWRCFERMNLSLIYSIIQSKDFFYNFQGSLKSLQPTLFCRLSVCPSFRAEYLINTASWYCTVRFKCMMSNIYLSNFKI